MTTRIRAITSRQNTRVKELRAAMRRPGRGGELVAIEGEHLLLEAQRSGVAIVAVFVVYGFENRLESLMLPADFEVFSLSPDVFASTVTTESPQPVAALVLAPHFELPSVIGNGITQPLVLVAAALQDPGNLGTLVRSAEAFGVTGLILLPGTTDPWSTKALRASAGSAFRLPIVDCEADEMLALLRQNGIRLLAAVARQDSAATIGNLRGPIAILIGNEGAGLSPELIDIADERITIRYTGVTESLNAAVAGSVLLYEAARQRGLA
jgi:TrmH family RNA methyltransferase